MSAQRAINKSTTVYNTHFLRFFNFFCQLTQSTSGTCFFSVKKRCSKMDPKLRDLPMIIHFANFLSIFLKPCFQNPTVLRYPTTSHIYSNFFYGTKIQKTVDFLYRGIRFLKENTKKYVFSKYFFRVRKK